MRLALAQMSMSMDMERNYRKSLQFLDLADEHKADLIFFPQLQFTPFFPQYGKRDVGGVLNHIPDEFAQELTNAKIYGMVERARRFGIYVCPNLYIKEMGSYYNASLWIEPDGTVENGARMVHVSNTHDMHEADYFRPSGNGFFVYDTPFGKVGIVIGADRHLPESITSCSNQGASLIIIAGANVETEPMEMYEWELRVAAFQNKVFIAMANRIGTEGAFVFSGQSIVVNPQGKVVVKADDTQQFIICNIELSEVDDARKKHDFRALLRPEVYFTKT